MSELHDQGCAATPTAAQKEELARRLADDIANPDDVEPWESVKAAALAQVGQ